VRTGSGVDRRALAAFSVSTAIAVSSVLLYRILTCWLPVFIGWPIMRLLTRNEMIQWRG
jgi:glycosyltransferase 2 family protein